MRLAGKLPGDGTNYRRGSAGIQVKGEGEEGKKRGDAKKFQGKHSCGEGTTKLTSRLYEVDGGSSLHNNCENQTGASAPEAKFAHTHRSTAFRTAGR